MTRLPAQHQDRQPGREAEMTPRPEFLPRFPGSGRMAGKVCVISGGDSGIGRAVAVLFAREGASLALLYLEEDEDAAETARLCAAEGADCMTLAFDAGNRQACGTAAAHAIQHGLGIEDTTSGEAIRTIQQQLLRDGCFLPNIPRADVRDLVPSATIEASSVHAIRGAGPETTAHHEGLAIWKDQPQYKLETLETRRGQLLSIGPEGIETLSLCLSNSSDQAQTLQAKLYALDHIWDYRIASLEPLGETVLEVPAGVDQAWIAWENLNLPGVSPDEVGRFLRIDVLPNDALTWHSSPAIVPGHTGFYQIGEDQMRRFASGLTLSFQTEPAQSVFAPEFIQREAARPHRRTNLWCCDPGDEAPSLTLRWDDPQEIDTIELTFPGHLVREYHAYAPFYRDAQTSADYRVLAKDASGNWESVVEVRDNYQTRVVHKLAKPISTRELRIELLRTHGDPVKSLYEVRCYGPE